MTTRGGIASGLRLGNLGFKVKGVSAKQVYQDPQYFKEILKRNKVVGFIGMAPTNHDHSRMVTAMYTGTYPPETSEGMLLDQQHKTIQGVEDKNNPEEFLRRNWHVDNPFLDTPPCLVSMHMTTYRVDPKFGQTFWVCLTSLYEQCPDHLKEHLKSAKFQGNTGLVDQTVVEHSALRTHPETGDTLLYWTGPGTALAGEPQPWFEELKTYVDNFCRDEHNRFVWQWKEGDVVVWDNRAVMHGFYPGWDREDRIFQRCEIGEEAPFFAPNPISTVNPLFGDVNVSHGVQRDESKGPNPDHIPLVFTKGIYALPGLEPLYQKVTLFVLSDDGLIPQRVKDFADAIYISDELAEEGFRVLAVPTNPDPRSPLYAHSKALKRYSDSYVPGQPYNGHVTIFSRNGDLHGGVITPDKDLFRSEPNDDGSLNPLQKVSGYLRWHPDMRHAGHAWHYPDWFPHQPLQFRPWDYRNLSFMDYADLRDEEPSEDFLVQFAIDTVYGCFNHLTSNQDRARLVGRIHDYIGYMMELGEYETDR